MKKFLVLKFFVQIGFKFMAGLEKKFEPGFLSDSKLFEKKKIFIERELFKTSG